MKKIIHHIRKQPEPIKRHILHVVIFACAIVLFILWVYSLGTTDTETKITQDLKPFSILKDNMAETYGKISESDLNIEQPTQ